MTLRAAVRGVIDYRKLDLHDQQWWKRWRYLVHAMEEETYTVLLQTSYKYQLALVSNPRISSEDFTKVQREAKELFSDIEGSLKPWAWNSRQERKAKERADFKEQWREIAGWDLDDAEAKAKWEEGLQQVVNAGADKVQEEEQAEKERQESFVRRAEEIRQKRLKQQGRKQ